MNTPKYYHEPRFSSRPTFGLHKVRARIWLILGAAVLGILGLLTWAAIALLSWLWGQFPTATEAGKRFAGEAITQVEQVAPGLKEQANQWIPGLAGELWGQLPAATEAGKRLANEAMTQILQVAPGVKEQVGQWVPGLVEEPPASDVSGVDVGPVPRFPGFVRSHFARGESTMEVRHFGRAAFDTVRAHYLHGFEAAGYAREVKEASLDAEHHRLTQNQESIDLMLLRQAGGRVEVRLKVLAP